MKELFTIKGRYFKVAESILPANQYPGQDLSICVWLYSPFVGPCPLFSFLILHTVGRTPWARDHTAVRPLLTHRKTQTQNKYTHTSMPCVGFEPTIQAFVRAKTVHVLDRAATVIGIQCEFTWANYCSPKGPTFKSRRA
jgi:hypothetical protein